MSIEYSTRLRELAQKQAMVDATLTDLTIQFAAAVNELSALKRQVQELKEKRGPGRPPKNGR